MSDEVVLNVINISSVSTSVAVTVPIVVSFSSTLKFESEVKTGAVSSTSPMMIDISWVELLLPSLTVIVAEYAVSPSS